LGVRGPKSKIAEQLFVECHKENSPPKMARFQLRDRQKSGQRDRQTESIVDNSDSWLGAEINRRTEGYYIRPSFPLKVRNER